MHVDHAQGGREGARAGGRKGSTVVHPTSALVCSARDEETSPSRHTTHTSLMYTPIFLPSPPRARTPHPLPGQLEPLTDTPQFPRHIDTPRHPPPLSLTDTFFLSPPPPLSFSHTPSSSSPPLLFFLSHTPSSSSPPPPLLSLTHLLPLPPPLLFFLSHTPSSSPPPPLLSLTHLPPPLLSLTHTFFLSPLPPPPPLSLSHTPTHPHSGRTGQVGSASRAPA